MDHLEFLGDTLEKIAAEKAAILKRGVPAVIAPQPDAALAVIERQARKVRAPLHVAGEHWNVHEEHGRLVYQDEDGLLDLPAPKLNGRHQFDNAGVAIAALRAAGLKLPIAAFESRHRQGRLAGAPAASVARHARRRWRRRTASCGSTAATTPTAAARWRRRSRDFEERVPRPLVLIVGMLATKDCEGYPAQFLRPGAPRVRDPDPATRRRACPPKRSPQAARNVGIPAERYGTHRGGARRGRAARARSAAAHPDRRLALSRGRSAGEERHAAGVSRQIAAGTTV